MPVRPLLLVTSLLMLAGCTIAPPAATPTVVPVPPAATPEVAYSPFEPRSLEALLLSEFAGHRQRADVALAGYAQQAHTTRDPGVVARATTIAHFLGQPQALDLSRLWTEVEPDSKEAWYLLALGSLKLQQYDQLIPALDRLLDLQPDADLEQMFLSAIPTTPAGQEALLKALDSVEATHADSPHILFARALIQTQAGQTAPALASVRKARQIKPRSIQATLLEAKLLTDLGQNQEAAGLLATAVKARPDSQSLRLNYARSLVRIQDMKGAEREFGALVEKNPTDDSLRLGLALIAFENRNDLLARSELEILTNSEDHADEAYLYLGKLAQRQGLADDAIAAYENVPPGQHFLSAMAETSNLLYQLKRPDESARRLSDARARHPEQRIPLYQLEAELLSERKDHAAARQVLNDGLQLFPANTALLLSRALVAERLDDLGQFERDVRDVLKREPDNASALNALGYTLLERTSRIDEAEAYIRRAHELRPDDPAILDSLGWARFKRGDAEGALTALRRAYALFADDEIAAHLGEVLWVLGQKDEARRIWADALRRHPASDYIPRTRMRLDP